MYVQKQRKSLEIIYRLKNSVSNLYSPTGLDQEVDLLYNRPLSHYAGEPCHSKHTQLLRTKAEE